MTPFAVRSINAAISAFCCKYTVDIDYNKQDWILIKMVLHSVIPNCNQQKLIYIFATVLVFQRVHLTLFD